MPIRQRRPDLIERVRVKRENAREQQRVASLPLETDEVATLRRELRQAKEREQRAFDAGFQACIVLVEHGADLERLRAAQGVPIVVPELDTDVEHEPEDTDVDSIRHG